MQSKSPDDNNNDPLDPEKNASGGGSFFELKEILGWVTSIFKETVPFTKKESQPKRKFHHISRKKREELKENAKRNLDALFNIKEELRYKYGNSSLCFIGKTIDPIIQSTIQFIEDISSKTDQPNLPPTLLEQAVQSVEHYLQYSDEEQLTKKIVQETITATKQAINTDCQILRHAFEEILARQVDKERLFFTFTEKLQPIFDEFQDLGEAKETIDDLHSLFLWKSTVDKNRGALLELGFLTIDTLAPDELSIRHEEKELSLTENENLFSSQLAFLSSLEEKSGRLIDLLENHAAFNHNTFSEIESLLSAIKNNANGVNPVSEIDGPFKSVQENISKAEELLEKRREQLHKRKHHKPKPKEL